MALINCYECGHSVSEKAKSCPQCGADLSRKAKRQAEIDAFAATPLGKRVTRILVVFTALLFGFIALALIFADDPPPPETPSEISSIEALSMCQVAFRRVALDPEMAKIPYVPDVGSDAKSTFKWDGGTKMIRMRNSLGLEVAATGKCIVDRAARQITVLVLGDEIIIN